jgi:hypothetical protein
VDYFSTSCQHADATVTQIRVGVTAAARQQIEQLVGDPKAMVERCVWRFIWTKHQTDSVKGESVDFTLDAEEILKLFADLRQIDLEEVRRRHRKEQSDKEVATENYGNGERKI